MRDSARRRGRWGRVGAGRAGRGRTANETLDRELPGREGITIGMPMSNEAPGERRLLCSLPSWLCCFAASTVLPGHLRRGSVLEGAARNSSKELPFSFLTRSSE